jgi:hypothetical protein
MKDNEGRAEPVNTEITVRQLLELLSRHATLAQHASPGENACTVNSPCCVRLLPH